MDQEQRLRFAIELVRTMMSSASSDNIRRIEWWSRAKTALETAALRADSFGSMVSVMARKLQIDVTTIVTGERIAALSGSVGHPDEFAPFAAFCAKESIYIVAIAQAEAAGRRAERERTQGDIIDHYGAPNLQPQPER